MVVKNAGRGADHCVWFAEETLLFPLKTPENARNLLQNVLNQAHRDLFFTSLRAGRWREDAPTLPDLGTPTVTTFADARDALVSGCTVIAQSPTPFSGYRDRFGFCSPAPGPATWLLARGVSDNPRRPGLVFWSPLTAMAPKSVKLPHGTWFDLPAGCFLVDADHTPTTMWAVP